MWSVCCFYCWACAPKRPMKKLLYQDEEALLSIAREASYIYTEEEVYLRREKEGRWCWCNDDWRYRERFSGDGAVAWEALVYARKRFGYGVCVRAERACGLVIFYDTDWIVDQHDPDLFWGNLYRRVEKACPSLYRYTPEVAKEPWDRKARGDRKRERNWRRR